MAAKSVRKAVLVCTEYRGVFFGYVTGATAGKDELKLENVRMAIYWGTKKGIHELCDTGPTSSSRISAAAPSVELRKITAVYDLTDAAIAKWEAA